MPDLSADRPPLPEQVYRSAAESLVGRFRTGSSAAANVDGYVMAAWFRAAIEAAWDARGAHDVAVLRRQADLPSLMHFDRPSDFRKGVLTCLAALEAEGKQS